MGPTPLSMVKHAVHPSRFGRSRLLFAASLVAAAGLAWVLTRTEPAVDERAAGRAASSAGAASSATALADAESSAAASERAIALPQAPNTFNLGSEEQPAPQAENEAAFLTIRILQATGEVAPGVGIQWIVRQLSGEHGEVNVESESNEEGLLAIEEQPFWWNALFGEEPGPYDGIFLAAGLRSSLPYNEYAETEFDESPHVLWLEEEPPRDRPFDLVLPPSGFVRFEWDPPLDGLGAPLDTFHLHVRRSDGDYFPGWRTGIYPEKGASSLLFGPVGLGWEIYGSLSSLGVVDALGEVRELGPTRAGETVALQIQINDEHRDLIHLTGIATENTDQALADTYLKLALADPDVYGTRQSSLRTDAEGRWSITLPRSHLASPIHLRAPYLDPEKRGLAWHDLTSFTGTVLDVGHVALRPLAAQDSLEPQPRFLASGRILDTAGTPIPRALVQIESASQPAAATAQSPAVWSRLATARTGSDGKYSLESPADPSTLQLRVTASHRDYRALPSRQVAVGSADVNFTLHRGWSVSFPFKIPSWAALTEAVRISFQGPEGRGYPYWLETQDGMRCVVSGLEPGLHRLLISLEGGDYVFVDREVEVAGDVELEAIDLTEAIAICAVQLVDPSGRPVESQSVQVLEELTHVPLHNSAWIEKRGRLSVAVPTSVSSVFLAIRGVGHTRVSASHFFKPGIDEPPEELVLTLRP